MQLALLSEPAKADKTSAKLWARQRRLSLKLLQEYWNAVEDDDAIMLDKEFRFHEWSENSHHFSGLFDRDSREIHGVIREVDKLGQICERTWKRGSKHGLSRLVKKDRVALMLHRDNQVMAELSFDANFNLLSSADPNQYFAGLRPIDFELPEVVETGASKSRLRGMFG